MELINEESVCNLTTGFEIVGEYDFCEETSFVHMGQALTNECISNISSKLIDLLEFVGKNICSTDRKMTVRCGKQLNGINSQLIGCMQDGKYALAHMTAMTKNEPSPYQTMVQIRVNTSAF